MELVESSTPVTDVSLFIYSKLIRNSLVALTYEYACLNVKDRVTVNETKTL